MRKKDCGFTLLELLIVCSLLAFMIGAVISSIVSSQRMTGQGRATNQANTIATMALDRIAAELSRTGVEGSNAPELLTATGGTSLLGPAPAIRFQKRVVKPDGTLSWSNYLVVKWFAPTSSSFPGRIMMWEDTNNSGNKVLPETDPRFVIAYNVKNFSIVKKPNRLQMQIDVERKIPDSKKTVTSTFVTTVAVANYN